MPSRVFSTTTNAHPPALRAKYVTPPSFATSPYSTDQNKEIVVDKTSNATDYDTFIADLPKTECCWAMYDFKYNWGEGVRNKILFIVWSPDNAKIKNKMLYVRSEISLRKRLVGIAVDIQATDFDEVVYESVCRQSYEPSKPKSISFLKQGL